MLKGGRSDIVLLAEQIAACHHECWDGTGYPAGLKGDAIPLAARITSVADVFDAMTSDRPYRPGLSMDEALAEIVRCSGSQFDPQIVDAMMAAVEGGRFALIGRAELTAV